jgi:hypothetical protein
MNSSHRIEMMFRSLNTLHVLTERYGPRVTPTAVQPEGPAARPLNNALVAARRGESSKMVFR